MSSESPRPMSKGVSVEHITKTPGLCGGRACIAGHRIRVMDIVLHHDKWGQSPVEISNTFPGITVADVYDALAYYHDHREEIEADFEEDRRWDEFGEQQTTKFKLAQRQDPVIAENLTE